MKRKERHTLAAKLTEQGGVVRPTKAGYLAKNPSTGGTVSWHHSPPSDGAFADKKLKSDLVRAGFAWPFGIAANHGKVAAA